MNSESLDSEQTRRGTKPSSPSATVTKKKRQVSVPEAETTTTEKRNHIAEMVAETTIETQTTPFSSYLQTIIRHNHVEIARIAHELHVAENTVYRWANGTSEPRAIYLKKLPELFPGRSQQLIESINATFDTMVEKMTPPVQDLSKEIYQRILTLATQNDDDEMRFWQVIKALFEHALEHLDPQHQGIVLTYAGLMPAHDDGIHSLREIITLGKHPWEAIVETNAYLGSTTLAGRAASLQHTQYWTDLYPSRTPVEIDKHKHSACAIPIMRGTMLAGVLSIFSTQADFFEKPEAGRACEEYALLLRSALRDTDYQRSDLLALRPMPDLDWQREYIKEVYVSRLIAYASAQQISRREAEHWIQRELEQYFEEKSYQHTQTMID